MGCCRAKPLQVHETASETEENQKNCCRTKPIPIYEAPEELYMATNEDDENMDWDRYKPVFIEYEDHYIIKDFRRKCRGLVLRFREKLPSNWYWARTRYANALRY